MKNNVLAIWCLGLFGTVKAQQNSFNDSLQFSKNLDSITVNAYRFQNALKPLSAVQGTYIMLAKKTESFNLNSLPADISNKTGRQVFAKVAGVFVYDMDGAGNQINIATRGLDPHRGWELNTRNNGVITNSDMYGYPASHFSVTLENIERVELVRGTGSLQYGAQFGGMLNYVSKQPDSSRALAYESQTTIGSYQLQSTYHNINGTKGKWKYSGFIMRKSRNGYRQVEHTNAESEGLSIVYSPSSKLSVKAEYNRSYYRYRLPGQLNDQMFMQNPQQATRSRNYFSPNIYIPSITIHWQISTNAQLQFVSSAVLGKRNSVLFDKPANIPDTINSITNQYNNRQVDIDQFKSFTNELRWLQTYRIGSQKQYLAAGLQYMNNNMHRRQLGKGTTGTDYDLSLVNPTWGRDLRFQTKNIAFYAENCWTISKQLSVTSGMRIEAGRSDMSGVITYYPANQIPLQLKHNFPLFGAALAYKFKKAGEYYLGWSQSYRPMIFKDLIPASVYEKVDANLKDASGFNAEMGWRGQYKNIRWDLSAFLLHYNNRFGTIVDLDEQGQLYTRRTNVGNSVTKGIELFSQADWVMGKQSFISSFITASYMHARYVSGQIKSGNSNVSLVGKKVETAPDLMFKVGTTFHKQRFSISVLYSFTGESFADPLNTLQPTVGTGAVGWVPSYQLVDLTATYTVMKAVILKCSVNNLFNESYFTKRPLFYPGPGIWPSDGRNISATVTLKL